MLQSSVHCKGTSPQHSCECGSLKQPGSRCGAGRQLDQALWIFRKSVLKYAKTIMKLSGGNIARCIHKQQS